MPSDPKKSKQKPPANPLQPPKDKAVDAKSGENGSLEHDEAVKTFVLEVSAGESPQAGNAIASRPAEVDTPRKALKAEKNRKPTKRRNRQVAVVSLTEPSDQPQGEPGKLEFLRRYFRNLSSLGVSFILHVIVLLLLSFYVLVTPSTEDDLGLFASAAPAEVAVDFSEIEIDPTENLEAMSEEFSADLIDPGATSFGELSAESALADVASDTGSVSDSLVDIGTLFGEEGQGLADLGLGKGGAMASFFGARVEAKRILYLLDNSGSMHSGRLETMIIEMIKSVEALGPKLDFFRFLSTSDPQIGIGKKGLLGSSF